MQIKALRQAKADNERAQATLKAEGRKLMAVAADKRSDEQNARLEAIEGDLDGLAEALEAITADLARAERFAADEAASVAAPVIEVGADLSAAKPWGHEVPANASAKEKRAAAEHGFGEFLQAVQTAGRGMGVDSRLYGVVSGASTGVPADGGFLVRTEHNTMLLDKAMEAAVVAPLCTEVPIGDGADGVEMPYISETSRADGSRWGGVQVFRVGEGDTVTAKKPKFETFEIRLTDLMGLMYATDRLMRDARSFGAIAAKAFSSEFAYTLDDEIINGTGAGECLGVLNGAATVSVSKETGQAAATFNSTNISKMWARLRSRSKANAVWFVNTDVNPQLDELVLPAGTAGLQPRFVTYGADGILRIKGRPVIEIEHAATLGTVGDVILADMSDYILATKGGLSAAESMHVRFLNNERTFRWTRSVSGAPATRSALTPAKGTATLSPYVTLATRS